MAQVLFAIFCVGAFISQNAFANPILASAFPTLPLPAITETCVDTISPLISQPVKQCVPSPNLIITDSSPSVCNNLANTLQLLIVSKLLQGNLQGCWVPIVSEIPLPNAVIAGGCGQVAPSPVVPSLVQKVLPNGLTSTTSCGCNTVLPQLGGAF
ncbi:hypothetical protein EVAR_103745_1 [Eumeta japonica]|uniref:Uncharacterized protein n=1 Tax=Eumeta variegata TaxID=151549 RepID=A0A4C1ZI04_EUMVA|nr:hypothetical protein EVAR_103745_1 [Eumeta japonica]